MRTADVTPLTVVYAQRSPIGMRGSTVNRTVVLATGDWEVTWATDRPIDGHRFTQRLPRESTRSNSGPRHGWLCLTTYPARSGERIRNADLIALAQTAWEEVQAGKWPSVPANTSINLVPARDIISTWEDHRVQRDQQQARLDAQRAELDARIAERQAAAQAAHEIRMVAEQAGREARDRIQELIGEHAIRPLENRITTPAAWVVLESAMNAYHQARLFEPLPESTDADF